MKKRSKKILLWIIVAIIIVLEFAVWGIELEDKTVNLLIVLYLVLPLAAFFLWLITYIIKEIFIKVVKVKPSEENEKGE